MMVGLKNLRGRISEDTFWRRYFGLRKLFYFSPEWRAVKPEGPKVCAVRASHKGRIDRHHKVKIFDNPLLALDPKNLQWLCRRCHKREHA